jgi:hypothetical protein
MSPLQTIIRSITIPASDIALVESVRSRTDEIGEIDRKTRPDGPAWINGNFCYLHLEVDRLADELAQAPTLEAAEALHAATIRLRDAGLSIGPIAASLRHAAARITAELTPIVTAVFDQADAALEALRKTSLSSAVKDDALLVDVVGTINARAAQLAQQLAAEREAALANPLQFLLAHCEPEVETPAPTPAPTPPAKPAFRGKVTLKPQPEPAPADDVLSELSDDDDDDNADPFDLLAGH